jgi:hypothetical protein
MIILNKMMKRKFARKTHNLILTLRIRLNHKYKSFISTVNYLKKNSN